MPSIFKKCIETWKKVMPDYEYILWDKNKFDTNSVPYVKEACRLRKWAFASDYIRLYAVYTEGGIYLDSDVIVRKSFSDFLKYDFFTSVECIQKTKEGTDLSLLLEHPEQSKEIFELGFIQAAIFGGIQGHPFLKDCLSWYHDKCFVFNEDEYYNHTLIVAPLIWADIAMKYGFNYRNELQLLKNNMVIFPSFIFAPGLHQSYRYSYAVHCCTQTWGNKPIEPVQTKSFVGKIFSALKKNNFVRKAFGKKPFKPDKTLEEKIMDIINDV
jgi:hypothetical protein